MLTLVQEIMHVLGDTVSLPPASFRNEIQRGKEIFLKSHSTQWGWGRAGIDCLETKLPKGAASTFSASSLAPWSTSTTPPP